MFIGGILFNAATTTASQHNAPAACERNVFPIAIVRRRVTLDGDTIAVTLALGLDTLRETHVRLRDVNAWEVRGAEKPLGRAAEQAAHAWLAQRAGHLEFVDYGDDKYGGRRDGIIRDAITRESLGVYLMLGGHGR
jgi:endonuclease YncB( thermonuclease family)